MYELVNTSEISVCVQVAFILAGCTHATYYKTLQHALGIEAVMDSFLTTIKCMYPIVKSMVDEMCETAKQQMKSMCDDELGSWKRAVPLLMARGKLVGGIAKMPRFLFEITSPELSCTTSTFVKRVGMISSRMSSTREHPSQQNVLQHA